MSDAPWLDLARAEMGTKRIRGDGDNPRVIKYFADSGHPEVTDDDVAWCAAFVGAMLKRSGLPNSGSLAARSYLTYGKKLDDPIPGCIAIFKRGNSSWEGHVAFFLEEVGERIRVLGGNQCDAVSIATYPKSKLLGYRWPVAPTEPALREAGSTEIATADTLRTAAKVVVPAAAAAKTAEETGAVEHLRNASEGLTVIQQAMEGFHAVLNFALAHAWVGVILGGVAIWFVGHRIAQSRIKRAANGQPISTQI